jgi:fluoroquinolone transport system permease protein
MKAFSVLGPIDARTVLRDSSLRWMLFLPFFTTMLIRYGVPPLTQSLIDQYGFDLSPYYPTIMAYFFIMLCPMIFSMLTGFVLLDERDEQTLTALSVTPLSLNNYFAYRTAIPILLTVVLLFAIFPLSGIVTLSPGKVLIAALAAAPIAPMFALFLASVANNKVQGFALMKLTGLPLFIPIFAFWVDSGWEYAFGIIPTYWPMKTYWLLQAGEPGVLIHFLVGFVYIGILTWLLVKRFNKIMHS